MTHDEFCQLGTDKANVDPDECYSCDWVRRVREDEQGKAAISVAEWMIDNGHVVGRYGYATALRDAVEAVKALYSPPSDQDPTPLDFAIYEEVIPAIESLGGER